MLIYKITNTVNGKIYIGQTQKTLEERIYQHKQSCASSASTHLYNAIRKYGWDSFSIEVVADNITTKQELDRLETYYIDFYDSMNTGYNMTRGGETNPMDFAEVRNKHDNVMRSEKVKSKIRQTMKEKDARGELWTESHRRAISENKKALYSSPAGDIARAKFRNSFKPDPKHIEAASKAKFKQVYCVDETESVIKEFNCVKDAAEWWFPIYRTVKSPDFLCDRIKESAKFDKYIKGLKWFYRV